MDWLEELLAEMKEKHERSKKGDFSGGYHHGLESRSYWNGFEAAINTIEQRLQTERENDHG
jgi:hypothetical protein